jgi:hypothetical protein
MKCAAGTKSGCSEGMAGIMDESSFLPMKCAEGTFINESGAHSKPQIKYRIGYQNVKNSLFSGIFSA